MNRNKNDDLTTYTIHNISNGTGAQSQTWRISKHVLDVVVETYDVSIKGPEEKDCWCNCPGFTIQKYDKRTHKHVRMIEDYRLRGQPPKGEYVYKIIGAGKEAQIKFIDKTRSKK